MSCRLRLPNTPTAPVERGKTDPSPPNEVVSFYVLETTRCFPLFLFPLSDPVSFYVLETTRCFPLLLLPSLCPVSFYVLETTRYFPLFLLPSLCPVGIILCPRNHPLLSSVLLALSLSRIILCPRNHRCIPLVLLPSICPVGNILCPRNHPLLSSVPLALSLSRRNQPLLSLCSYLASICPSRNPRCFPWYPSCPRNHLLSVPSICPKPPVAFLCSLAPYLSCRYHFYVLEITHCFPLFLLPSLCPVTFYVLEITHCFPLFLLPSLCPVGIILCPRNQPLLSSVALALSLSRIILCPRNHPLLSSVTLALSLSRRYHFMSGRNHPLLSSVPLVSLCPVETTRSFPLFLLPSLCPVGIILCPRNHLLLSLCSSCLSLSCRNHLLLSSVHLVLYLSRRYHLCPRRQSLISSVALALYLSLGIILCPRNHPLLSSVPLALSLSRIILCPRNHPLLSSVPLALSLSRRYHLCPRKTTCCFPLFLLPLSVPVGIILCPRRQSLISSVVALALYLSQTTCCFPLFILPLSLSCRYHFMSRNHLLLSLFILNSICPCRCLFLCPRNHLLLSLFLFPSICLKPGIILCSRNHCPLGFLCSTCPLSLCPVGIILCPRKPAFILFSSVALASLCPVVSFYVLETTRRFPLFLLPSLCLVGIILCPRNHPLLSSIPLALSLSRRYHFMSLETTVDFLCLSSVLSLYRRKPPLLLLFHSSYLSQVSFYVLETTCCFLLCPLHLYMSCRNHRCFPLFLLPLSVCRYHFYVLETTHCFLCSSCPLSVPVGIILCPRNQPLLSPVPLALFLSRRYHFMSQKPPLLSSISLALSVPKPTVLSSSVALALSICPVGIILCPRNHRSFPLFLLPCPVMVSFYVLKPPCFSSIPLLLSVLYHLCPRNHPLLSSVPLYPSICPVSFLCPRNHLCFLCSSCPICPVGIILCPRNHPFLSSIPLALSLCPVGIIYVLEITHYFSSIPLALSLSRRYHFMSQKPPVAFLCSLPSPLSVGKNLLLSLFSCPLSVPYHFYVLKPPLLSSFLLPLYVPVGIILCPRNHPLLPSVPLAPLCPVGIILCLETTRCFPLFLCPLYLSLQKPPVAFPLFSSPSICPIGLILCPRRHPFFPLFLASLSVSIIILFLETNRCFSSVCPSICPVGIILCPRNHPVTFPLLLLPSYLSVGIILCPRNHPLLSSVPPPLSVPNHPLLSSVPLALSLSRRYHFVLETTVLSSFPLAPLSCPVGIILCPRKPVAFLYSSVPSLCLSVGIILCPRNHLLLSSVYLELSLSKTTVDFLRSLLPLCPCRYHFMYKTKPFCFPLFLLPLYMSRRNHPLLSSVPLAPLSVPKPPVAFLCSSALSICPVETPAFSLFLLPSLSPVGIILCPRNHPLLSSIPLALSLSQTTRLLSSLFLFALYLSCRYHFMSETTHVPFLCSPCPLSRIILCPRNHPFAFPVHPALICPVGIILCPKPPLLSCCPLPSLCPVVSFMFEPPCCFPLFHLPLSLCRIILCPRNYPLLSSIPLALSLSRIILCPRNHLLLSSIPLALSLSRRNQPLLSSVPLPLFVSVPLDFSLLFVLCPVGIISCPRNHLFFSSVPLALSLSQTTICFPLFLSVPLALCPVGIILCPRNHPLLSSVPLASICPVSFYVLETTPLLPLSSPSCLYLSCRNHLLLSLFLLPSLCPVETTCCFPLFLLPSLSSRYHFCPRNHLLLSSVPLASICRKNYLLLSSIPLVPPLCPVVMCPRYHSFVPKNHLLLSSVALASICPCRKFLCSRKPPVSIFLCSSFSLICPVSFYVLETTCCFLPLYSSALLSVTGSIILCPKRNKSPLNFPSVPPETTSLCPVGIFILCPRNHRCFPSIPLALSLSCRNHLVAFLSSLLASLSRRYHFYVLKTSCCFPSVPLALSLSCRYHFMSRNQLLLSSVPLASICPCRYYFYVIETSSCCFPLFLFSPALLSKSSYFPLLFLKNFKSVSFYLPFLFLKIPLHPFHLTVIFSSFLSLQT
ncbi:unnamed protein product [Acanthosepion pharaonis]|uniref:Uncharacterized protein n=1 Tax=Acanthosepion pharaonis TaxID=158019 RepID=A0A812B2Z9_ACAPH|nr:unnamed protein product [Sepia pharaonis]